MPGNTFCDVYCGSQTITSPGKHGVRWEKKNGGHHIPKSNDIVETGNNAFVSQKQCPAESASPFLCRIHSNPADHRARGGEQKKFKSFPFGSGWDEKGKRCKGLLIN